jgi:hypothetical protein
MSFLFSVINSDKAKIVESLWTLQLHNWSCDNIGPLYGTLS